MEQGADLHMAQLMPLPLTVFCFSKIQIGSTFLVLAHPCGPGKKAIKRVCVYVGNTVLSASHTHIHTFNCPFPGPPSTPPLCFLQAGCPSCRPTASKH